jgi:hypothetical protein
MIMLVGGEPFDNGQHVSDKHVHGDLVGSDL